MREIQELLDLAIELRAITYGFFRLSQGRTSTYYFDGRVLSLHPEGAYRIAKLALPFIYKAKALAVGGPTLGADPIATAIAFESYKQGKPIPAFIVRKEEKEHGTGQLIEGPSLSPGTPVALVDDTCSTGASIFHAITAVEKIGCRIVLVLTILDRQEGGSAQLQEKGYTYVTFFRASSNGKITTAL